MLEELGEVVDVGVDGHLVLPLELGPHLAELGVGAVARHDVVHDVDVDVVQHDAVTVAGRTTHVVHYRHRLERDKVSCYPHGVQTLTEI